MRLNVLSLPEWNEIAEQWHKACFEEQRPASMNRCDYALVVTDSEKMICYTTILEFDSQTAHMQHGGSAPEVRGTALTVRGYKMMMQWLREKYSQATTHIGNWNIPMLKMAMNEGFLIVGADFHNDGVCYLHLFNEFKKE